MSWYDLVLNTMSLAILATGTATLASLRWPVRSNKPAALRRKIPSPRETLLPHLSVGRAEVSPYPPDLLPGARDLDTPYGVMRVYEWGPEEGLKVLLIHGDTTPRPMLGPIASQLAERGCRVMIVGQSFHHILQCVIQDLRAVALVRPIIPVVVAASRPLSSYGWHRYLSSRPIVAYRFGNS